MIKVTLLVDRPSYSANPGGSIQTVPAGSIVNLVVASGSSPGRWIAECGGRALTLHIEDCYPIEI